MRLDAFLKKSLLIKRRELANQLCDEGMVRVNGVTRKASQDVKAKDEQWSLFEVLEDKRLPLDLGFGDEDPFAPPPKAPRNH